MSMSRPCFFQIYIMVLLLPGSPVFGLSVRGVVGQSITLPCTYNVDSSGVTSMCWGRGDCPARKCTNEILSIDVKNIIKEKFKSGRYHLYGNLAKGNVSLTIENLTEADTGIYCCRVEIPGLFNDQKEHFDLMINRAPIMLSTSAPGNHTSEYRTDAGDFSSTSAPVSPWKISAPGQKSHNTYVTRESSDNSVSSSAVPQPQNLGVNVLIPMAALGVLLLLTLFFVQRCYRERVKTEGKTSHLFNLKRKSGSLSALQAGNQTEDNIYSME